MAEPGLVSREVVKIEENHVTIREVWNVKTPGCPLASLNPDLVTYGQEVILSKREAELRGLL